MDKRNALKKNKLKINKFKINLMIICSIVIVIIIFLYWQNNGITTTTYYYENPKLPSDFEGFTVVQVSDLHNKNFHGVLSNKIIKANPDIIVITGDIIDSRRTKIPDAIALVEELRGIAPIYYVSGNHEQRDPEFESLKAALLNQGVHLVDGTYTRIEKGGEAIGLLGIADPLSRLSEVDAMYESDSDYVINSVNSMFSAYDVHTDFNILLSHRPELVNAYVNSNMDLVFTGHAHGGQVRLPFLGGLIAPNQGFFPKLTEGIHQVMGPNQNMTSVVVSRGLGNSIVPIRIFNRPELIVVKLSRGGQ